MKKLLIIILATISLTQSYDSSNAKVKKHLYSGRYRFVKIQAKKNMDKPMYGKPMFIESIGRDNPKDENPATRVVECDKKKQLEYQPPEKEQEQEQDDQQRQQDQPQVTADKQDVPQMDGKRFQTAQPTLNSKQKKNRIQQKKQKTVQRQLKKVTQKTKQKTTQKTTQKTKQKTDDQKQKKKYQLKDSKKVKQ